MRHKPKLVLRRERSFGRRSVFALTGCAVVAGLALAYFAGVYWDAPAHLSAPDAAQKMAQALAAESGANAKLRMRADFLEQSLALANQSETATRKSLSDEQAKQVALRQKLAFYEGILTQGASQLPVKIAGLQIIPTGNAREYRFQIVLVRARGKAKKSLAGTCSMAISGKRAGKAARLTLAEVMPGGAHPIKFKLRYFSNLGGALRLPPGFTPGKVDITIILQSGASMTGSYSWPAFHS